MALRTLYFDESGFTGYNLLDERQPVFAIASTDLSSSISREILCEAFPRYQGEEFKFTKLWRSKRNRERFPEFGRRMAAYSDRIYVWRVDKRFAVLTKIIDYLIEPGVTEAGFDFYADGFSLNYANYIHCGLNNIVSEALHSELLRAYQRFSRNPSHTNLRKLQRDLERLAVEAGEPMRPFLEHMALGARYFTNYFNIETFSGSDELQLTSMVTMVGYWRNLCAEDFEIVHDASSNFFHRMDDWKKVTNSNVPKQLHPSASGTLYQFPLRVTSTKSVDSKMSASIQLCDLLAGLAARDFGTNASKADREILESTLEAGLGHAPVSGIAPEEFDPSRLQPQRREGPDAVDRMTEIMFGRHNSPSAIDE